MYKITPPPPFTAILVALAVVAANPAWAGGAPPPPQVTASECRSEYGRSPASATCSLQGGGASVTDNKCNIYTKCTYTTTTGNDRGNASITGVAKGDVSRISHCGGLVLQVGSC